MKDDILDSLGGGIDLLYPDKDKRNEMKKRRGLLSRYPQDYIKNLELSSVAKLINPYNVGTTVNLFSEICDDIEIINYRLDILEDFLNIPKLAVTIKQVIDVIVENDRKSIYKLSDPDSFDMLNDALSSFEAYIQCMEIMHEFGLKNTAAIKSEGIKRMLDFFESSYNDKHYIALKKEVEELKEALTNRIKSVTVAINLDERMIPISAGIIDYHKESFMLKPSLFDRILYHGSDYPKDRIVKSIKNKYFTSESTGETVVNTVDEALFEELNFITDKYVKMINDVLAEYQKIGFKDILSISYQLEYYTGAVSLINLCRSSGLQMCRPTLLPSDERAADIKGVFDLLYFSECRAWNLKHKGDDKRDVIVNDISFDDNGRMFILTGANNGGKTTFVRALGVCQILSQAGLYVPASECTLSVCDYVYTHFPKEEQIGIDASKFTSEIKEFKAISDTITPNSLLLMNESIQSTTPNECIEVSKELLTIFCMIGVRGILATHLIDLAKIIDDINSDSRTRSVIASLIVTVDENTGQRLYKIVRGMPGSSRYTASILDKYGIDIAQIAEKFGIAQNEN